MQSWVPSGLSPIPQLQRGSHLAHFFGSGDELRDVLVPYFKAGLENNEQCLWVTGQAFNAEDARSALRAAVPDLDHRELAQQIEIADAGNWYAARDKLRPDELVRGLIQREQDALARGYQGLRTQGNCAWVSPAQWPDFLKYESLVQDTVRGRSMICMCSYCADLSDRACVEVGARHDITVPTGRRGVSLDPLLRETSELSLLQRLERQQRTFDIAMTASKMGTWRYTLADNICIYDENAQRLYGLNEGRFLHDEQGVTSKFHPEDIERMWSRVQVALDPLGDGRYEAEYRVRQSDGSWRWLSAWGLVEFEGEDSERRPVAITGASRDLTERKQAEELQRVLLDELNHRVKNTFATIQAISAQTLRMARDLPSAAEALSRRIQSMAEANDLLTQRAWTGASLGAVVKRALKAFPPTHVNISGPNLDVSPKHVLSLSLALHELATNATKYGALSVPDGRVSVVWSVHEDTLVLTWEEAGGPPVVHPSRKGFGSRLLEHIIGRDLGGQSKLAYDVSGLRCCIRAKL